LCPLRCFQSPASPVTEFWIAVLRGADLARGLVTNKNSSLKVELGRRWSEGVLKRHDGRGNYALWANRGSLIYFEDSGITRDQTPCWHRVVIYFNCFRYLSDLQPLEPSCIEQ
jgi:hypothetical protein